MIAAIWARRGSSDEVQDVRLCLGTEVHSVCTFLFPDRFTSVKRKKSYRVQSANQWYDITVAICEGYAITFAPAVVVLMHHLPLNGLRRIASVTVCILMHYDSPDYNRAQTRPESDTKWASETTQNARYLARFASPPRAYGLPGKPQNVAFRRALHDAERPRNDRVIIHPSGDGGWPSLPGPYPLHIPSIALVILKTLSKQPIQHKTQPNTLKDPRPVAQPQGHHTRHMFGTRTRLATQNVSPESCVQQLSDDLHDPHFKPPTDFMYI
ncbi:hypothetical protein C2E23DRAFT_862836 [Lenzites betulinus]|nr:hypothetical protein C2E23DRAFT_862836 [Lenzites betulinus]